MTMESKSEPVPPDKTLSTMAAKLVSEVSYQNSLLLDKELLQKGTSGFAKFGAFGLLVRLDQELETLKALLGKKRRAKVSQERLDIYKRISNYALIAYLIDTQQWPKD